MAMVKRAIVMAAGIGKRMQPITLTTPKPLVRVNGVRMIETVINALHQNHIDEIYIVVGYLKEQFQFLIDLYPGVVLIENPYYDSCNNISSLYMARDYLEDVIVLDGDQMIYNSDILSPEFEQSGYNAIWTDEPTDEWILTVDQDTITGCSRTGGEKGWQLFSVSRWNSADGKKLKRHLEIEFEEKGNTQIYWDDVPIFCYPDQYDLKIRKMKKEDVVEIDGYEELLAIDSSYQRSVK